MRAASRGLYHVTDTSWPATITWTTRPPPGPFITTGGSAPIGVAEFDLTGAVGGNGTYSFVLKDGGDNAAWYSSKEGRTTCSSP